MGETSEATLKRAGELAAQIHTKLTASSRSKHFEWLVEKLDAWAQEARLEEAKREWHDEHCENQPTEDCACRKRRIAALEQPTGRQP